MLCGLAAAFCTGVSAQAPGMDQMPLNPKVKSGVLPNGMSYYIMHNEEPKERANFYIAQKVGSTLEEPTQLGLAHFLEHMAFNGTTNYPGKNLLNYLQSKGIRFGADINAYTAFDETVYNINNVITTDQNLMDSVLLALHDWSGEILLEESEIDAERGVIQEEWRSRNNASYRMYSTILPEIYKEYQYQQMPIGKMDVVMNFKPEALRAYYKKWYRPDQQGIVIVGDFDAAEMEKKVIDLFSKIPMPANAAPREYPAVSDNEEPIFVSFSDPELTNMQTIISFKSEKIPFEYRNSIPAYVQEQILEPLVTKMINNRLSEFAQTADCRYAYAGTSLGDFLVSKTKASFDVMVIAKNDSRGAVEDAMAVVARACKTGFNDAEFERASQELMANLEKLYNERDKTDNEALGRELCSHFIDNEPAPGIETEYQIWQMVLPQLPLNEINELVKQLIHEQNMVVVTSAPKADGIELVTEEAMLSTLKQVMNAEYEALQEEKITEPLISSLPAPGTILSEKNDPKLQANVMMLSNGVTVVVKPTDFAGDEVLMYAYRNGGKRLYEYEQAANVLLMGDAFEAVKMGPFDTKTLKKYLAGKKVSLGFNVNTYTDVLEGNSTVKDLPYLFELIYSAFNNISPDEETYNIEMAKARPMLEMQEKNPQTIFMRQMNKTRYADNPLMANPTVATLDNANYSQMYDMVKSALGNPAEYTFIFVGNVTPETLNPLIEKYIASMPTNPVVAPTYKSQINQAKGQVKNEFKQPMEAPATMVVDIYSQSGMKYTLENEIMVELLGDILDNVFTDTLREEEGGTYSPYANGGYNPNTQEWNILYLFYTNADQQAKLIARADQELMKLFKNGVDEVNFNKAKEAMIKQYEINSRKNEYWTGTLSTQMRFPQADIVNGYETALRKIDRKQFNKFLKSMYNGKNRIQVIMEGVAKE